MEFRNENAFLSNMYPSPIRASMKGQRYEFTCAEALFQAMKCPERAAEFQNIDGPTAKKLGQTVQITGGPEAWEARKVNCMKKVIQTKFEQNPELMKKLVTLQGPIVEDNDWGDTFWGVSKGQGQNQLGKILEAARGYYQKQMGIQAEAPAQPAQKSNVIELHNVPTVLANQGKGPGVIAMLPYNDTTLQVKVEPGNFIDDPNNPGNKIVKLKLDDTSKAAYKAADAPMKTGLIQNQTLAASWDPATQEYMTDPAAAFIPGTELRPAKAPAQPTAPAIPAPTAEASPNGGLAVCFTGHRPKELAPPKDPKYKYSKNAYDPRTYNQFVDDLTKYIDQMYDAGYRTFITGGAQGFDQLAFWAVNSVKSKHPDIQNIVYAPFQGQETPWMKNPDNLFGANQYRQMLGMADKVVFTDQALNTGNLSAAAKLQKRNEAMVRDADAVVALFRDPAGLASQLKHSGTLNCMKTAYAAGVPTFQITFTNGNFDRVQADTAIKTIYPQQYRQRTYAPLHETNPAQLTPEMLAPVQDPAAAYTPPEPAYNPPADAYEQAPAPPAAAMENEVPYAPEFDGYEPPETGRDMGELDAAYENITFSNPVFQVDPEFLN